MCYIVGVVTWPVCNKVIDTHAVGMVVDVGVSIVDDDSDDGAWCTSHLIKFIFFKNVAVHVYL